jgi:peptide/nickel transport system permease protein
MGGLTPKYLLRRLGMFVLTIWLGATIIFIVPRLAPGDPVAAMVSRLMNQSGYVENSAQIIEAWRVRFGLDGPIWVQYLSYLRSMATFNLGYSLASFPSQVDDLVANALPWTVGLLTIAVIISFILGNTIGALLAWRRTPGMVRALLPLSLTFTSIPAFMLGILIIYLFAFGLKWFPVSGAFGRGLTQGLNWEFIGSVIYHGTLPALSVVVTTMGFWALGMRGMMITNDGEDYMILAEAKGLRPSRVFWLYGVRNSILPQVTALALNLGLLAGGSVLVEYIFAYPGMGYLLYQGIVNTDYTLIQGIVFILILGTALAVLIIDLLYPLIDPRITYERG